MKIAFRRVALGAIWMCVAARVPAGIHPSITDRAVTFDSDGVVLSTAVVCPGYAFDQFGRSGPTFSPDNHWLLVEVKGPFTPGNVPRTAALVQVMTGAIVFAPSFPTYLGVPTTLEPIAWASGRRATLAYAEGKSATIHDPPLHPIPALHCATGTTLPDARQPAAPVPSASPYAF